MKIDCKAPPSGTAYARERVTITHNIIKTISWKGRRGRREGQPSFVLEVSQPTFKRAPERDELLENSRIQKQAFLATMHLPQHGILVLHDAVGELLRRRGLVAKVEQCLQDRREDLILCIVWVDVLERILERGFTRGGKLVLVLCRVGEGRAIGSMTTCAAACRDRVPATRLWLSRHGHVFSCSPRYEQKCGSR